MPGKEVTANVPGNKPYRSLQVPCIHTHCLHTNTTLYVLNTITLETNSVYSW